MKARVTELLNQLIQVQDELAEIRKNCPHTYYTVGWWSWRVGAIMASRICDDCKIAIPGITQEEEKALGPLFPETESGGNS
jgi:hypothetical protein